jgi:hypothetical protein
MSGFIIYLSIEERNSSDKDLFLTLLEYHQSTLKALPNSVVADSSYASLARGKGIKG